MMNKVEERINVRRNVCWIRDTRIDLQIGKRTKPRLRLDQRKDCSSVVLTMGDVASKVTSDNAVPGGTVFLVKLLLHECGDILLDGVLLEGSDGALNSLLLHLLCHVGVLDGGAWIDHGY